MKIFQTILDTENVGSFLLRASYDKSKVLAMELYEIDDDEIVRDRFPLPMSQMPLVVNQIVDALRESGEMD